MRKAPLFAFGLVVAVIVALGLIVLSSASETNAMRCHHGDPYFFMKRQFIYLAGGIVVGVGAALFDYRHWRNQPILTWAVYGVTVLALCAVFAFKPINGSRRWINLVFFNFQPSELAKVMTVIVTAMWLDASGWRVELLKRGALCPVFFFGILAGLVMIEPDFGSTMVIGLVGFLVMWVGGSRMTHIFSLLTLGGAVGVIRVLMEPNRMARISAWLCNKGADTAQVVDRATANAMHQGRMALAAIANGGIFGVGLGQSMQKHAYLPEAHTDMIFAIGAEELGLPFSLGVVLLFLAFFGLSIYIALKASDRFGRLLVVGMSFIIFFQAMFNIGVVCEALPMKGMALPFFSYGGTNMLMSCFAVGTILSVGIHSYVEKKHAFMRNVVV